MTCIVLLALCTALVGEIGFQATTKKAVTTGSMRGQECRVM